MVRQGCPDLFVVPQPDQTFMNLFNISNQLDQPSNTVLTKDREHSSHVVIVHELHPS